MIGAMEESDPGRHRAPGGRSPGYGHGIVPGRSGGSGGGESVPPLEVALPIKIGAGRLRTTRLFLVFFWLPLVIGSAWFFADAMVTGSLGAAVIALLCLGFFAYMSRPSVWIARLVLDDSGIRWRTGIGESGVLPWSQVAGVLVTYRSTSQYGGLTYHSASIGTVDGGSTLVARGSAEQPWSADEMRLLTSVVDRYKRSENGGSHPDSEASQS